MSLAELREAAVLGRVVERVAEKQSFCGETLLQKSAYFLKELLGVPLSTPFRIYYYGPYSFDLHDRLNWMEALDVVRTEPHEWGAAYKVGNRYAMLQRQFSKTLARYDPAIDWVVRELAPMTVKQLEPVATALFLTRQSPRASVESRAEQLHAIKPHVSVGAAMVAIRKVDQWLAERDGH